MMRLWRRRQRALVCRDAVALLTAYLDGDLPDRDRSRLEAPLAECPHCSEYLAQIRITVDALGHVEVDALPEETVDELVVLYRKWRAGGPRCNTRTFVGDRARGDLRQERCRRGLHAARGSPSRTLLPGPHAGPHIASHL